MKNIPALFQHNILRGAPWRTTRRGSDNHNVFQNVKEIQVCFFFKSIYLYLQVSSYFIQHLLPCTDTHLPLQIHLSASTHTCYRAYRAERFTVTGLHACFPCVCWLLDHCATSHQVWQVWQLMCDYVCVCAAVYLSPPPFLVFISFGQLKDSARSLFSTSSQLSYTYPRVALNICNQSQTAHII